MKKNLPKKPRGTITFPPNNWQPPQPKKAKESPEPLRPWTELPLRESVESRGILLQELLSGFRVRLCLSHHFLQPPETEIPELTDVNHETFWAHILWVQNREGLSGRRSEIEAWNEGGACMDEVIDRMDQVILDASEELIWRVRRMFPLRRTPNRRRAFYSSESATTTRLAKRFQANGHDEKEALNRERQILEARNLTQEFCNRMGILVDFFSLFPEMEPLKFRVKNAPPLTQFLRKFISVTGWSISDSRFRNLVEWAMDAQDSRNPN